MDRIERGSGNVFADLGLPDADAHLLKAELVTRIDRIIRQRPGDVLIIEEPEAHLHPGMQTMFAREIAHLIHSGVRVIMTTHSEWFLEQIGNLVRLSSLAEDKREGIAGADVALRPQDVGAWLFKPRRRPKGSVVEEVVLDPETGLFPTDHDPVSETLYNDSAEIFNRLQKSQGQ